MHINYIKNLTHITDQRLQWWWYDCNTPLKGNKSANRRPTTFHHSHQHRNLSPHAWWIIVIECWCFFFFAISRPKCFRMSVSKAPDICSHMKYLCPFLKSNTTRDFIKCCEKYEGYLSQGIPPNPAVSFIPNKLWHSTLSSICCAHSRRVSPGPLTNQCVGSAWQECEPFLHVTFWRSSLCASFHTLVAAGNSGIHTQTHQSKLSQGNHISSEATAHI